MKAKWLVLMLCIGMMCFTGFGQITADPTEDSEAEIIQMDDASVNVVTIVADQATPQDVQKTTRDYSFLFAEADQAFDRLFETQTQNLYLSPTELEALIPTTALRTPDIPVGDVGWSDMNENLTYTFTAQTPRDLSRNPRDGLRC